MAPALESVSLKLHIDQKGQIWYLAGEGAPRSAGRKVEDFVSSRLVTDSQHIRVIGSKANVNLIVELYWLKLKGLLKSLQVCSPMCAVSAHAVHPAQVLHTMRRWGNGRSASTGGWHEFNEVDYATYHLAYRLSAAEPHHLEISQLVRDHPVWPAISFIPNLDIGYLSAVLSNILDPRWFVDPDKPDRGSKIEAFMGLHPKTQCGVSGGGPKWRLDDRCRMVLKSWQTSVPSAHDIDTISSNFLWRIWQHHGKGYMADLRTSQSFLAFLRFNWLHAIYRHTTTEPLFVPEYFFAREDEIRSYKEHILGQTASDF